MNDLSADIDVFKSGEDFLNEFEPQKYQILFQDIYMKKGGLNGLEVCEKIREHDGEISIIFISLSREHGPDTYDVSASYYMFKPLDREKLENAMEKCRRVINNYAKSIEIMVNRKSHKVRMMDIYYIEVYQHNCLLHTFSGTITTNMSLSKIAALLDNDSFIHCHRSYLVNLAHVERLGKNSIIMKNGDNAPISRIYAQDLQKAFSKYFWHDE